jgi:hypothetical protein
MTIYSIAGSKDGKKEHNVDIFRDNTSTLLYEKVIHVVSLDGVAVLLEFANRANAIVPLNNGISSVKIIPK